MRSVYLVHFKAMETPVEARKMMEKVNAFELSSDCWLVPTYLQAWQMVSNLNQLISSPSEGVFLAPLLREEGLKHIVNRPDLLAWFEWLESRDQR